MRNAFILLCLLFATGTQAKDKPLYRFVDADGVVHFTDKAPNKHAKPMKLGPSTGGVPMRGNAVLPPIPRYAVYFDTPTPGQVYSNSAADVPVAMSVMPGLVKDFGLILRVDDKNIGQKTSRDLRASLRNPGAGSHVVMAVLVNTQGQELARSTPLTIHIRDAATKK